MSGTTIPARSRKKHERKAVRKRNERSSLSRDGWVRFRQLLAIALASAGIFVLVYLLSFDLRWDVSQIVLILSQLDASTLKDWVLSFGALSPLVYFLVVVAQVIVSPIPAGPVTLAGALVFGIWKGLTLSMAGSVVGSVLVFAAARRWGEPLIMRLVGKETYYRYAGRLHPNGWWLFAILLLPLMPDDAVCALAGLSAITFRRFLVVTILGRLPGATLTALLASEVVTQSAAGWIVVGIVLVVLLALGSTYRERLESWILRRTADGQGSGDSDVDSRRENPR